MTVPALILGILVSTLMGAAAHLLVGGQPWKLVLFLILGWIGFWGGHLLGDYLGWTFWSVGPLRLGTAIFVALIVLAFGYWLSLIQVEKA